MRALPDGFIAEISKYPQLAPLASSLLCEPTISVRANAAKGYAPNPDWQPVPWCSHGFYLDQRPSFTFDPSMHQGRFYVQDASSMAIAPVVTELAGFLGDKPIMYLDACAAPGGKTTAALSSLPSGSLVVANEYDFKRAQILCENINKWGLGTYMVSRGDTKKISALADFFDIVAVDAPCSGEGMMRKDHQAIEQWSPRLIEACANTQRQIVSNVWRAIKPGGFLIYSTCTFNLIENEQNIQWIADELGGEPIALNCLQAHQEIEHGINCEFPCYRFLPGRVRGEGLFLAILRKPGDHTTSFRPQKAKAPKKSPVDQCAKWLKGTPADWLIETIGDDVYATPKDLSQPMLHARSTLDCIAPALRMASIKGRDIIPSQELALSVHLRTEAFAQYEADKDTAIAYLQRQSLSIDAPKGFILLTFNNVPLGFVKNLGNRANNLYPKSWRILSQWQPS